MKRVCASLLTASMIVTSLSSAAFAEDTPTTAGWTTDHSAYFYQVGDEWKKADADTKEVAPTCTEAGKIIYTVAVDGVEPYVETGKPATGHTSGAAVKENEVAPGCIADGSYDEVTYCTVCNEELSRTTQTVPATGHTASEAVEENRGRRPEDTEQSKEKAKENETKGYGGNTQTQASALQPDTESI